jgi:very-short-patch-repair endonuclease
MEIHHQKYNPEIKNFARTMRKEATYAEDKLWQIVRNRGLGVKFRRQFNIDSKYIADFVCLEKRLIIELDGSQHGDDKHSEYDEIRTEYLNGENFTVLRFWNNEILKESKRIIEKIKFFLVRPEPLTKIS